MSIVRTRRKDCEAWPGGCACSLRPQPPPAGAMHAPGLCLHHTAWSYVHTQGWGPCRTCRRQARGSSEELGQVAILPRWEFHFSTALPFPRLSPTFVSVSVHLYICLFPMSRSLSVSLVLVSYQHMQVTGALGPASPLPEFLGLISIWPLRD